MLPAQSLVVDGVVTALYLDGRPREGGLAAALAGRGEAALAYYLTDLLFLNGHDLAETPLARRKELLGALVARVKPPGVIRLSERRRGFLPRGLPPGPSRHGLTSRRRVVAAQAWRGRRRDVCRGVRSSRRGQGAAAQLGAGPDVSMIVQSAGVVTSDPVCAHQSCGG
jgi:hypothetical protein